jgi:hypothetical protein
LVFGGFGFRRNDDDENDDTMASSGMIPNAKSIEDHWEEHCNNNSF